MFKHIFLWLNFNKQPRIGDLLIDDKVVGKDLENIDLEFRLEMNEEGHRIFSDFGTADLFFEISACVKASDGAEVVPLCLGLNMDKTHMSRLSDINAWPCNGLIMNLKTSVLSTRKGSRLLGYCPILNMSDRSLAPFLLEAGISKSKQVEECKIYNF